MPEPEKTCLIEGCTRPAQARSLCCAHYQKLRLYGSPTAGKTKAPNGAGYVDKSGYRRRLSGGVEKPEHVRVCETVLGKPLPEGAVVHHLDGDKLNNATSNLVICQDSAFHNFLHARIRAFKATGNPSARLCCRCGEYDTEPNLSVSGKQAYHPKCNSEHTKKLWRKKHAKL